MINWAISIITDVYVYMCKREISSYTILQVGVNVAVPLCEEKTVSKDSRQGSLLGYMPILFRVLRREKARHMSLNTRMGILWSQEEYETLVQSVR